MIDYPSELTVSCDGCSEAKFTVPLSHYMGDCCGVDEAAFEEAEGRGWECNGTADGDTHYCPACVEKRKGDNQGSKQCNRCGEPIETGDEVIGIVGGNIIHSRCLETEEAN